MQLSNEQSATKQEELSDETLAACAVARGERGSPEEPIAKLCVGRKEVSSRGSVNAFWYALRWQSDAWVYPSDDRLTPGGFRAHERRQSIHAETYEGDLFVTHDRGKGTDKNAWLIARSTDPEKNLVKHFCPITKLRSGMLRITLPDGSKVERPNPRQKVKP